MLIRSMNCLALASLTILTLPVVTSATPIVLATWGGNTASQSTSDFVAASTGAGTNYPTGFTPTVTTPASKTSTVSFTDGSTTYVASPLATSGTALGTGDRNASASPVTGSTTSGPIYITAKSGNFGSSGNMSPTLSSNYFSFSLTVSAIAPNTTLSVANASFYIGNASAPRATAYQLAYSSDNVNFTTTPSGVFSTPTAADNVWTKITIPVSLAGLDAGDGAYFRVYLGTGGSGNSARVDDFTIQGEFAPIPEPGSFAMLLLGGVMLWSVRRKRG